MTSLATSELKKLKNPQFRSRIVPETMRWAHKWIKQHNIYNVGDSSPPPSTQSLRCESSQQTLTQLVRENTLQKTKSFSVYKLTSEQLEYHIQRYVAKYKPTKSKRRTHQSKQSDPQMHFTQTKLNWNTKCKPKQTSKTIVQRDLHRHHQRKHLLASKWKQFLDPTELALMYPARKQFANSTKMHSSSVGTELKHFLIRTTSKRPLDTCNESPKPPDKTPRLLTSTDCKTR